MGFTIWYGGWSIGLISYSQMRDVAVLLANRIVVMSGEVR